MEQGGKETTCGPSMAAGKGKGVRQKLALALSRLSVYTERAT